MPHKATLLICKVELYPTSASIYWILFLGWEREDMKLEIRSLGNRHSYLMWRKCQSANKPLWVAWSFVEISWVDIDLLIHRRAKCSVLGRHHRSPRANVDNAGSNTVTDNCHFAKLWVGGVIHLGLSCCLDLTWLRSEGTLAWSEMSEIEKQKARLSPLLDYEPCFPKLAAFWKQLCLAFEVAFKFFSESPLTVTNLMWWEQLETENWNI